MSHNGNYSNTTFIRELPGDMLSMKSKQLTKIQIRKDEDHATCERPVFESSDP
jgi:hypothetical protein